jgi:hypothetical protein
MLKSVPLGNKPEKQETSAINWWLFILILGNNKIMKKNSEPSLPMWKAVIILIIGGQVKIHHNE